MSGPALRTHPTRDAIVDAMRQHPAPISPTQLALITGATLGSTAYHVQVLLTAGVIELVAEERGVRGAIKHLYKLSPDDAAPLDSSCP